MKMNGNEGIKERESGLNKSRTEQQAQDYNSNTNYVKQPYFNKDLPISGIVEKVRSSGSRNSLRSQTSQNANNKGYQAFSLNVQEHQDRIKRLIEERNSTISQINKSLTLDELDADFKEENTPINEEIQKYREDISEILLSSKNLKKSKNEKLPPLTMSNIILNFCRYLKS